MSHNLKRTKYKSINETNLAMLIFFDSVLI
jgi:hypothetical protein